MTHKTIFVLTGRTESGDDIGPYAWPTKPTEDQILKVFMRDIPEEVEAECCDDYSVEETIMEDM
jgi:hypothetical protein